MSTPELEDAFRSALAEIETEKESSQSALTPSTRSKAQMASFLKAMDWSDKQLHLMREAVDEALDTRRRNAEKAERVQTYKAKLINLSKELNLSYKELLVTMADMEARRG